MQTHLFFFPIDKVAVNILPHFHFHTELQAFPQQRSERHLKRWAAQQCYHCTSSFWSAGCGFHWLCACVWVYMCWGEWAWSFTCFMPFHCITSVVWRCLCSLPENSAEGSAAASRSVFSMWERSLSAGPAGTSSSCSDWRIRLSVNC